MNQVLLSTSEYIARSEAWLAAWNRSNAEAVSSFYAEKCDYRDPSVPDGITSRRDLFRYLRLLFRLWPEQNWSLKAIFPHEEPGSFSATYDFRFANARRQREVKGNGMDLIVFEGDLVRTNWVYLNGSGWADFVRP